ncbi:MAG: hypothetical protein Q8J93_08455 [Xanthomonadales bacterium]|nr:hypothetical protein [Xanthomonadales bacterium]MDZ4116719.1 hypothetical protein [Xanthomonadaceae bacterium]MDZ4379238.1 hypothetical protein [Xanthomonadaceae bacterium]
MAHTQESTIALANLTIGVTAHRHIDPAREPLVRQRVREFLLRLQHEFPDLPLQLVSALAAGGDQLVAEEALALDIPVLAPLPMAQAEYERDFDDPETLRRFRNLLARSEVRILPLTPGNNAEDIAAGGAPRDRQYAQLGVFVSSHCQILLALWDGEPSAAVGGTAEVVHFHLHESMPALGWSVPTPNQLAEETNDLVYHMPCVRITRKEARGEPPPAPRWLTADRSWPGTDPIPHEHRVLFMHMQAYNRDLCRHGARIDADAAGLFQANDEQHRDTRLMHRLDTLYRQSDWLAVHYQRRVRHGLIATHLLAVAMGLAYIAYDNVHADWRLLLIFLLCFGIGWLWYRVGQRRDWHRKYLDYRALAEGLRVQLYWHLAGVRASEEVLFAYDSFLQKQDIELGWIRHVMRGASLIHDRRRAPGLEWLHWSIADWVGSKESHRGQLSYYARKSAQCEARYRITRRVSALALVTGLGVAVLLIVLNQRLSPTVANYLLVLVGLLPLIAGVRNAYGHKQAEKELIKQYRFMGSIFARARKQLDVASDDDQRRGILKALGEACLQEHTEWILMHRERPLEQSQLT